MRRILILIPILLCSLPAFSAIARDGTCTASAASCTFSATATGDLKIIMAYRASATRPTLPSGWLEVVIGGIVQGTNSVRMGCKISTSSGDTGSGTWTNATQIVGVSYSGTAAKSAGMSCLSAVGATSTTASHGSSTTVNFPALQTLNDNTSWVLGLCASTVGLVAAPAGMTQFTSAGSIAGANDTNATVTTWASTNVTVSTRVWMTATIEIVAPASTACGAGVPCLVQSYSGSSNQAENGNGFVFNLPNATLADNLLVCGFTYAFSAGRTVAVSDNKGNTWTAGPTTSSGNNTESLFYVPNVPSGTQQIKVTFDAPLFFWQPHCWEFYNIATSTPSDGTSNANSVTGPYVPAGNITTTGTNDLIIQYGNVDNNGPGNAHAITAVDVGAGFLDDGTDDLSTGLAQFAQHRIAPTATTINPTMGILQATQDTFGSVAMAFKSATAGTAPSAGIYIIHEYAAIVSGVSSSTLLFPSSGNLIVAAFSIDRTTVQIGVSDNLGNSYTLENPSAANCGGTILGPQIFHADNATPGNGLTLTITQSNLSNVVEVSIYDITGAATAPWDKNTCSNQNSTTGPFVLSSVNTTGVYQGTITGGAANAFVGLNFSVTGFPTAANNIVNKTVTASTATALTFSATTTTETHAGTASITIPDAPDITPTTSNGLIIGVLEVGAGPPIDMTSASLILDSIYYTGQTDASKTNAGEGHFHYYNPNTSLVAPGYSMANANSTGWMGMATAFEAPAVTGKCAACDLSKLEMPK